MLKKVCLCVVVLIAMIAVIGCSKGVVGTWTANGPAGAVSLNFKGDGTFEAMAPNSTTPVFSGTYTVKDKTVEMTMTKMMGMEAPKSAQTAENITLSDDGKTMTIQGLTFTKQ